MVCGRALETGCRTVCRPFRAWAAVVVVGFPGRCPGLVCCGPFGARDNSVFLPGDDAKVSFFPFVTSAWTLESSAPARPLKYTGSNAPNIMEHDEAADSIARKDGTRMATITSPL